MRRTVMFLLLAGLCGAALAQAQGSCTFVYNSVARKIDMTCQGGMRHAPLDVHDRAALTTGKAKACVVRFDSRVAGQPATKQAPRPGWVTTCK